ncbi:MAG: ribonuclease P protein component [Hahellaceae bacterium]|nr:ribonuclease P protein component [Hahellaceae bacterium]
MTAREFSFVFEGPAFKAGNDHFLILAKENQLQIPRVGFVFAKKNVKLACSRNMLRRVCREVFRLKQNELPAIDIVVLTRRIQTNWTKSNSKDKFSELLTKIQLQHVKKYRPASPLTST